MGTENDSNTSFSETGALIDFLYVDKARVDSLISQLRNGTLRSVTKTIGTSEGSTVLGEVGIPTVTKGAIGKSLNSDNRAAEQYDPYHSQLIALINDLNVNPLERLPESCSGQLVLIHSKISIRDTASIKAIMSILNNNTLIFGKALNREARANLKFAENAIKVLPDSISLSVNFKGVSIT